MINGLEGIPGSGKSYEAVVYHVLAALQKGRKVITNLPLEVDMFSAIDASYADLLEIRYKPEPIRGTWDAERKEAFELFPDAHLEKPVGVRIFGHVWDFYSEWKDDKGGGPLFVIDECHVPLPRIGTPIEVEQWFKLHRHFNVDVLLMTQRFRGVNEEIAHLMGMLVKVRKADILGRSDSYIRKVHGGYRGAVISTEERKYKPELFPLYRSHTQGNSVQEASATDVKPFIVRFRRYTWAIIILGLALLMATLISSKSKSPFAVSKPAHASKGVVHEQTSVPVVANPAVVPVPPAASPAPASDAIPEPFATKSLHLTGRMSMAGRTIYTFLVSQNGLGVLAVTDADLERSGYRWKPLTDCTGTLYWQDAARAVSCDSPQVSMAMAGSQSVPK